MLIWDLITTQKSIKIQPYTKCDFLLNIYHGTKPPKICFKAYDPYYHRFTKHDLRNLHQLQDCLSRYLQDSIAFKLLV